MNGEIDLEICSREKFFIHTSGLLLKMTFIYHKSCICHMHKWEINIAKIFSNLSILVHLFRNFERIHGPTNNA